MTDSENLFLIDTNVLVYAFDNSEKKKQKRALEILNKCFDMEILHAISSQTLAEFFHVVTRKIQTPILIKDAKDIIIKINEFNGFKKIDYNSITVIKAAYLIEKFNLKFWDALLIATMLENNIFNIYTENEKDFNKVNNINVVNPFK